MPCLIWFGLLRYDIRCFTVLQYQIRGNTDFYCRIFNKLVNTMNCTISDQYKTRSLYFRYTRSGPCEGYVRGFTLSEKTSAYNSSTASSNSVDWTVSRYLYAHLLEILNVFKLNEHVLELFLKSGYL